MLFGDSIWIQTRVRFLFLVLDGFVVGWNLIRVFFFLFGRKSMQDGGFVIGRKRGLAPLNQDTSMSMGGREIERSRDREFKYWLKIELG